MDRDFPVLILMMADSNSGLLCKQGYRGYNSLGGG